MLAEHQEHRSIEDNINLPRKSVQEKKTVQLLQRKELLQFNLPIRYIPTKSYKISRFAENYIKKDQTVQSPNLNTAYDDYVFKICNKKLQSQNLMLLSM